MDVGAKVLGTRWAARAPIAVFKAHLGFLFAGRMLLLQHRGRMSGAERFVVVESADREDPNTVLTQPVDHETYPGSTDPDGR